MRPQLIIAGVSLAAIMLMMLAEWQLARFNERILRHRGAVEPEGDVYGTMAWVYPGIFAAMAVEGALFGPPPGKTTLAGAAILGLSKILKFWAIASLGTRWTFRVLVLPDAPLVARGPYAWLRHPNYVAVLGELAGAALLMGARVTGVAGFVWFALLLRRRVAVEERALDIRRSRER
jgi:methyltransferase